MEEWRDIICNRAMLWLGTPYIPRARVMGVGADCGTLLYDAYEPACGPFLPMPTDYAVDWAAHQPTELYLDFIMPYVKEVSMISRGGFTLFHMAQAYAHAAIFLGNGNYIHAWGRKDAGQVMITPARVLHALASPVHPMKHFEPR